MDHARARAVACSGDVVRHFAEWQDRAALSPIHVTHHGRERIVILSADTYRELAARPKLIDAVDLVSIEKSLTQVSEQLDQGFIAFDVNLKVRAINSKACEWLSLARETLIGEALHEHRPGVEASLLYASLVHASRSGSCHTFEARSFVRGDRWLFISVFTLGGRVACLFRDITDALHARRLVEAEDALLKAAAVHGGIGCAGLADDGIIVHVDQPFAQLTGYTSAGLIGSRFEDLLASGFRKSFAPALQAAATGRSATALQTSLLTRDERERTVHVQLMPARSAGSAAAAVMIMTG